MLSLSLATPARRAWWPLAGPVLALTAIALAGFPAEVGGPLLAAGLLALQQRWRRRPAPLTRLTLLPDGRATWWKTDGIRIEGNWSGRHWFGPACVALRLRGAGSFWAVVHRQENHPNQWRRLCCWLRFPRQEQKQTALGLTQVN